MPTNATWHFCIKSRNRWTRPNLPWYLVINFYNGQEWNFSRLIKSRSQCKHLWFLFLLVPFIVLCCEKVDFFCHSWGLFSGWQTYFKAEMILGFVNFGKFWKVVMSFFLYIVTLCAKTNSNLLIDFLNIIKCTAAPDIMHNLYNFVTNQTLQLLGILKFLIE